MKFKASSSEDITLAGKDKKHSLTTQGDQGRYYLPLPLSAALGVTSFSDSKLYSFHQSHEVKISHVSTVIIYNMYILSFMSSFIKPLTLSLSVSNVPDTECT